MFIYCDVWLRVFVCSAVGATVVNRTEELKDEDVGTECGLFDIQKIGDEWVLRWLNVAFSRLWINWNK